MLNIYIAFREKNSIFYKWYFIFQKKVAHNTNYNNLLIINYNKWRKFYVLLAMNFYNYLSR